MAWQTRYSHVEGLLRHFHFHRFGKAKRQPPTAIHQPTTQAPCQRNMAAGEVAKLHPAATGVYRLLLHDPGVDAVQTQSQPAKTSALFPSSASVRVLDLGCDRLSLGQYSHAPEQNKRLPTRQCRCDGRLVETHKEEATAPIKRYVEVISSLLFLPESITLKDWSAAMMSEW